MKKTSKKLALATETLRTLTPEELGDAGGGTQLPVMVYYPRWTAVGCPTYDPACFGTINTIGMSPIIRF